MLANLIETLARPGLLGLAGQNAEKRLRRALESYFRILGRHAAGLNLEALVDTHSKDLVRHAVEMRLANTLRILAPLLKTILEAGLSHGMLAADKIHHFAEADTSQTPSGDSPAMLTGEEAALWASVHAGEQVSGINATTLQLIADAIEKGFEQHLGPYGTARLLRQVFQDMTVYRSQMIAATEMNRAFSEAALRKLDRMGVEYKQWILGPAACDACEENAAASPILTDDDFPSGDAAPPAHPNCKCAVTGSRPPTIQ